MIFGVIFLLTVSLVTSAAIATFGKWWGAWFGGWETLAHVLDLVVNFGLLTLIFALIYKMIPRVHVGWRDVWTGSGVTALLFVLGKFLIGLYLGKSDVTSSFGAAGSLVLMMVWVYYSAQIFLFGAEFTWVYANAYGSRRDQAQSEKAAATAEGDVPTRSDTGKAATVDTAADRGSERPATALPYGAALSMRDGAEVTQPSVVAPIQAAAYESDELSEPATPAHRASVFLRDNRAALAVAVTTAVLIGVVARFGAVKRLLRKALPERTRAVQHRRLAS
jgi:hypothetical protein